MGWFKYENEKKEVSGMKEMVRSLRNQLDLVEDEIEEKKDELECAYEKIKEAEMEKQVIAAELRSVSDSKFRVEKALDALKTGKSDFDAVKRRRNK